MHGRLLLKGEGVRLPFGIDIVASTIASQVCICQDVFVPIRLSFTTSPSQNIIILIGIPQNHSSLKLNKTILNRSALKVSKYLELGRQY